MQPCMKYTHPTTWGNIEDFMVSETERENVGAMIPTPRKSAKVY